MEDRDTIVEPVTERALGAVLTRTELTQALATLTAEQRTVVTLRFLEFRNIAETALLVGKSEDAVKKLQARGLLALRRALAWEGTPRADRAA